MDFSEIFEDKTKYGTKLKTDEYEEQGKYLIVDQGQELIAGYTDKKEGFFSELPVIIFGDHTRILKYIDQPFYIGADGVKILRCKFQNANYKYLFYALKNVYIPNTGYNRHFKWLKQSSIKYPDSVTQNRIVKILDTVSSIIELHKKELDQLECLIKSRFIELFGNPSSNPMGWKETTVGAECYYIKDGPHKSLPDVGAGNGYPFISVRNIVNGYIDFSTAKYISEKDYIESIKKCHPQKGDMLYSKGGTTGIIAKLIDVDIEFANWVHVAVLKFDDSLNGVFFENMLNCDYCYAQSQRLTKGIANRDLVLSAMAQIKMYKPPLELQEQFAAFVAQTDKSKLLYRFWGNFLSQKAKCFCLNMICTNE